MSAVDLFHAPIVTTILTSIVAKHSVDGAKWLATEAAKHPVVRRLLPWIAAAVGFGLNVLMVWVQGGDVAQALAVSGPEAGLGAIFYHNVLQVPDPK